MAEGIGHEFMAGHSMNVGTTRDFEYTPTTEVVRYKFSWSANEDAFDVAAGAFDRWLAQVKADAWDEAVKATNAWYVGPYKPLSEQAPNPYRNGE